MNLRQSKGVSPPLPVWLRANLKDLSERGHDRHDSNVFDSEETTVIDAVTNQNTTALVVTENKDS